MIKFRITTPELVSFQYVIAGLATRCLAWLVDQTLILGLYVVVIIAFASLGGGLGIALIILCIFIIDFSYFVLFELYRAGQSPGKKMFKIRVISARGGGLCFTDVLIRNLLRPIDLLPWGMVVGGAVAVADRWSRRLGDIAADTIVIRDIQDALPSALAHEKSRINSFQSDSAIRNRIFTRISRDERDLIMELTLRRDQIEPTIREELFHGAAEHFRSRLNLPSDLTHLSDEQTVINLALLIQEAKFTA